MSARTVPLATLGVLAVAGGLALPSTPAGLDVAPPREEPRDGGTPLVAASMIAAATNAASATCTKPKPVKLASAWRTCTWDGEGKKPQACAKYGPVMSDKCAAEAGRSSGVEVDYRFFGEVDCRSSDRKDAIHRIVIHNGDTGANNNENWKCRPSSAHYTVDRDGKIFQHIGEERVSWHAAPENHDTVGIELAIKRKYGGTCNSLPKVAKIAAAEGIAEEDVIADLCGPTLAQYQALAKLVDDIGSRHAIASTDGIFGHCEVVGTSHGDPKAFDWRRVGVAPRKAKNICGWYHVMAIKGTVIGMLPKKGGTLLKLDIGAGSDIEAGDHGYIENDAEVIKGWFTVDSVDATSAMAWVPVPFSQMVGNLAATVVATPGRTPAPLAGKALGGAAAGTTASAKPSLGSCESDYTYWKSGRIRSWTTNDDGTLATLTLEGVGWKHRVCDDAAGMIYVGDASDAYVTDAGGTKLRFRMTKVDETTAVARVFEGKVREADLGSSRRVVVRAKK
ncbi:MAG: N-acetylmuramoyl-L-alanine amidase [Deltaproteobacteria bacterium]|nr:N-acetylmuramoyl-L-alanine amidase [Deltaproteobacteria bacterium]MBP7285156.1 N-acetylmuramoyl-L-alanine amidase [Nannocystaceae bacterium]